MNIKHTNFSIIGPGNPLINFGLVAGFYLLLMISHACAFAVCSDFNGDKCTNTQVTLYASPDGSGNLFSMEKPGSLTGVQAKVRSLNSAMKGDIVINLMGGTYKLESTLDFISGDSGTNGFTVIWQACPGEVPVLSGGTTVSKWMLSDKMKNIWKAQVDTSLKFRQLYIKGERAVRARTPNMTCYTDKGPYSIMLSWNNFHPIIQSSLLLGLTKPGKVEFCVNHYWQHFRYRLASFSITGDTTALTFKLPEGGIEHPTIDDRAPFILENAYEFLDAEGEWYLDSENSMLYYKPRKGELMTKTQAVIPVLETILNIAGTQTAKVHDIQFRGISFQYSNWTAPDDRGYTSAQAAIGMDIPGMVEVSNASHILFERNVFKHAGGFGLVFSPYSDHNRIEGNVFTDISANGIVMDPMLTKTGNQNQKDSLYSWMVSEGAMRNLKASSQYDIIRNNLVEYCGRDYNDAVGIYASLPDHLLIQHNEVRNLTYSGISVGWSWRKEQTPHRDGEISYNKVHDVCLTNPDGGAIYILGTVAGSGAHMHHNYTYNVYSPNGWAASWAMAGLYTDGPGANNILLDYNVINNCTSAFHNGTHTSHPNLHFNYNFWQCPKLWCGNGAGNDNEPDTNARESGNTRVTDNQWPAEAKMIMDQAGIEPEYHDILK